MNGGRIEKFFDTKFKRALFRWMLCIFFAGSWIMKDIGVNRDIRFVLTSFIWIAYGGLCAYIFKNGIDLRYNEMEEWGKYRMELKVDIVFGVVLVALAVFSFFKII